MKRAIAKALVLVGIFGWGYVTGALIEERWWRRQWPRATARPVVADRVVISAPDAVVLRRLIATRKRPDGTYA